MRAPNWLGPMAIEVFSGTSIPRELTTAAMEYARRLKVERERYAGDLEIVMRVYFEKPRTTVGWKGLINDPRGDGSYAVNDGLRIARGLLLDVLDRSIDHNIMPTEGLNYVLNSSVRGLAQLPFVVPDGVRDPGEGVAELRGLGVPALHDVFESRGGGTTPDRRRDGVHTRDETLQQRPDVLVPAVGGCGDRPHQLEIRTESGHCHPSRAEFIPLIRDSTLIVALRFR